MREEVVMARRDRLRKRLKQLLPAVTVTLTTIPFAVWSPSASAFFPPVWGPPSVTLVPPVSPPVIAVPPASPPVFVTPPSSPPPIIVVPPSPPPNGVPEPATVISGLLGLAAAAGYGLKRRQAKKEEPKSE